MMVFTFEIIRCLDVVHRPCLTFSSQVVILCTARFDVKEIYVLSTQCIYVFCMDLRTNGDYFPTQH